jgi:hypothetical protein
MNEDELAEMLGIKPTTAPTEYEEIIWDQEYNFNFDKGSAC